MYSALPSTATDHHDGHVSGIDPRARIVVAVVVSVTIVLADRRSVSGVALAAGALAMIDGVPLRVLAKRLLPFNVVMLLLALVLPLSTPGESAWRLGPLGFSSEGLRLAAAIALKGNGVALTLIVLLGAIDTITLGHALRHLYVPEKLTHLLLFMVRYLEVLHQEHVRLRAAMKVRGFRPRMDRHTYRSFGYLVGMLLVRSLDRAERIFAAMKCRGFRGRFYLLDHFSFGRRDAVFCAAAALLWSMLVMIEWRVM
jgi:cobalt/nickel transport system permease protein